MATTYFPFDAGAGANVTESSWLKMAKLWRTTGVVPAGSQFVNSGNDLAVTAGTGLSVNVAKGTAWIKGHYFNSDATITKTLSPADPANPRIDLIVLRLDWVANTITVEVLQGTPSSNPSAPIPTTIEGSRWEMPLAQVNVAAGATQIQATDITDLRDPSVEGGFTPAAKVFRSSTYSVPNVTETAIPFDQYIYDNCNMWNGGYKLTVPRTGFYYAFLTVAWTANSTGTRYHRIRRNGTQYIAEVQWQPYAQSPATNTMTCSTVARLTKGDYIEGIVYQSSGGSLQMLSLSGVYPMMGLIYIGE